MRRADKPKLVIICLIAVFLVMLGIGPYAPAYVTSYSTQSSSGLTMTRLNSIHPNDDIDSSSSAVQIANYTGLFYVQHVCLHDE